VVVTLQAVVRKAVAATYPYFHQEMAEEILLTSLTIPPAVVAEALLLHWRLQSQARTC